MPEHGCPWLHLQVAHSMAERARLRQARQAGASDDGQANAGEGMSMFRPGIVARLMDKVGVERRGQ